MTKFDPSQIKWRVPWWPVPPERDAGTASELHREICAGHVLFGRTVQAVGRRQDCDDVLFYLGEAVPQFAVVHLTYARETRPEWPETVLFDTLAWISSAPFTAHWKSRLAGWIERCMVPDADDLGS